MDRKDEFIIINTSKDVPFLASVSSSSRSVVHSWEPSQQNLFFRNIVPSIKYKATLGEAEKQRGIGSTLYKSQYHDE